MIKSQQWFSRMLSTWIAGRIGLDYIDSVQRNDDFKDARRRTNDHQNLQ